MVAPDDIQRILLTRQPNAHYFAWTNEQWILHAYQALNGAKVGHIPSDSAELSSAGGLPPGLTPIGLAVNASQAALVLERQKYVGGYV